MNNIKKSAIQFSKTINLKNKQITYKKLLSEIRKKGYIVKSYSESATLLMAFGLYDDSKEADSVSTIDKDGVPYIFIDGNIADMYQLFILAHELGHIVLKHRKTQSLKKQQEREADLFAHYLLSSGGSNRKNYITITAISGLLIACIVLITVFITNSNDEKIKTVSAVSENYTASDEAKTNDSTVCYFTQYGTVYHIYEDCYYLKNSNRVYCDTIERSHKDRLCSACERRKNDK